MNGGLHFVVVNSSKLIWSSYGDQLHTALFKQGTQFSQRGNGIDVCLALFLRGKSNLYIAQSEEDICKPSCKLPGNIPDSVSVTVCYALGLVKYVYINGVNVLVVVVRWILKHSIGNDSEMGKKCVLLCVHRGMKQLTKLVGSCSVGIH